VYVYLYFDTNYIHYRCQAATRMINMFPICMIMSSLVLDLFNLYDSFYTLVVIVT